MRNANRPAGENRRASKRARPKRARHQRRGGTAAIHSTAVFRALTATPGIILALIGPRGEIAIERNTKEPPNPRDARIISRLMANGHAYLERDSSTFIDRFEDRGEDCEILIILAGVTHTKMGVRRRDQNRSVLIAIDRTSEQPHQQSLYHISKFAALGELAMGIAHELTQPLNVIMLAAENGLHSLSDQPRDSYLTVRLEKIVRQVRRMAKIIDHLRIYGRPSEKHGVLFNPWTCAEIACQMFAERFILDGIELRLEPAGADDAFAFGHPDQIEQVIINLVSNARDAILEKKETVESGYKGVVSVECVHSVNGIEISVTDNGVGIDDAIKDKLFDPFFTTKAPGKGTGLGLSIATALLKEHRGSVRVDTMDGTTSFTIMLPRLPAAEAD